MTSKNAIVVGAGIVGLAAARALALAGYRVDVFEKSSNAAGASIRNFGLVWPVGQLPELYGRAIRSRNAWIDICDRARIWHNNNGSMHLAHEYDEMQVLDEFYETHHKERNIKLLNRKQVLSLSTAVNKHKLIGGLYSVDELTIDSRKAIAMMPAYFAERMDITFHFDAPVTAAETGTVWVGNKKYHCDELFICSGAEFESLYPSVYYASALTKCKLQMMRTVKQPNKFNIGPTLCGGLILASYAVFKYCPSSTALKERVNKQYAEYVKYGIHVMAAQNDELEITIGDSHEYGLTHDPFDRECINKLILEYMSTFLDLPRKVIQQTWNGTYVKMKQGTELIARPEQGVTIVNGLGGAGMTLSFGLLEEIVEGKI